MGKQQKRQRQRRSLQNISVAPTVALATIALLNLPGVSLAQATPPQAPPVPTTPTVPTPPPTTPEPTPENPNPVPTPPVPVEPTPENPNPTPEPAKPEPKTPEPPTPDAPTLPVIPAVPLDVPTTTPATPKPNDPLKPIVIPVTPADQKPAPYTIPIPATSILMPGAATPDAANGVPAKAPEREKSPLEKILGPIARGLTVTGGGSLAAMRSSINGSNEARQQYSNSGNTAGTLNSYNSSSVGGPVRGSVDMTISGKVLDMFDINAHLSNQRYGNFFNQRFGFNYKKGSTAVSVGDVQGNINGNGLVSFARTVQGVSLGQSIPTSFGTMNFSGVASMTRAVARRDSFQGQGTSGPYFLNASSIIEGTDRVRLNGNDLQRDTDYKLDYQLGQLSFLNGRIINPEDTVEYTFEAQSYNNTAGILTGARWDMTLKSGPKVGLTWLNQKAAGRRNGNRDLLERFAVQPDLAFTYNLAARIQDATPIEIRWRDQLLLENKDYILSRANGFFRLRTALPADTAASGDISLSVVYQPVRQSSVGGDRSVLGLDGAFALFSGGTMNFEYGRSAAEVGTGTGTGMKVNAIFQSQGKSPANKWTMGVGWTDIGLGFSGIDSVSNAFTRATKGLQGNMNFAPIPGVDITSNWSRNQTPNTTGTYYGQATTGPVTWATSNLLSYGANINLAQSRKRMGWLPNIRLNRQTISQLTPGSSNGNESRSTFATDNIEAGWQKSNWSVSATMSSTASKGRSVFLTGYNSNVGQGLSGSNDTLLGQANSGAYSQTFNDSKSVTQRLNATMQPLAWLNLRGSLGFSKTAFGSQSSVSTSAQNSKGRDTGMDITVTPVMPKNALLTFSLNMTNSQNGQSTDYFYNNRNNTNTSTGATTTTAGTSATTASTLGGVGSNLLGGTIYGQRSRGTVFNLQYQPQPMFGFGEGWLGLNFSTQRTLALVPGSDNSENSFTTLGLAFAAFRWLPMNLQYSTQKVTQVGGQGDSFFSTWSFDTGFNVGRFTLRPSVQLTQSNSSSYFGSSGGGDGFIPGIGNGVGSTRATRQATGSSTTGTGNGYFQNQRSTALSLTGQYPIGGGRTIDMRWEEIDAKMPVNNLNSTFGQNYHTSNNYRRGTGSIGLSIPVPGMEFMAFSISANVIRLSDRDDSKYSYNAQTWSMDLGARF